MSTHLQSLDTPLPGEVPVWVTDHWEFGPPVITEPGITGGSTTTDPLRLATKYDWGGGPAGGVGAEAPDLRHWGSDPDMGEPIYADTADHARARPQIIPDASSKLASDLPGTYPQGLSIMSIYTATAGTKGWPSGVSCTVVTHRRVGDADVSPNVEQWWYQNSSPTNRRMMVRHGHPGGWSGWRPVLVTYENILSGTNLNTLTNPGYYPETLNANASTTLNYPVALAGLLEVGKSANGAFCWQRYTIYGPGKGTNVTYTRCFNEASVAWSPWVYPPKADIAPTMIANGFTARSGWAFVGAPQLYRVQWNLMCCHVKLDRTGADIPIPSTGDLDQQDIADYKISSTQPAPLMPSCGLKSGDGGRTVGVLINSAGVVRYVSAATGTRAHLNGDEITFSGIFPIDPARTTP